MNSGEQVSDTAVGVLLPEALSLFYSVSFREVSVKMKLSPKKEEKRYAHEFKKAIEISEKPSQHIKTGRQGK